MKKISIILLVLVMLFCSAASIFAGGGGGDRGRGGAELALVTDYGTIDDGSFNQGSWEGVVQYAQRNNIAHRYFQPPEISTASYLATIDLAIRGGARVVVTPGFLFNEAIFIAQDQFPDVRFILVDSAPRQGDVTRIGPNTVAVYYAEDQAGFLAGYAAVRDGFRRLGFMGGIAVPAVQRFGFGFIQGAEYAAQQLGLPVGSVTVRYTYTGTFTASPAIQTQAAAWFMDGVEVIFACGGGIGFSIMAAAEAAGRWVIGVDIDQANASPTVITSAMKELRHSVYTIIADHYRGQFPGGQALTFEAANQGVGLPMATSRFRTFSQADYDAVFARLVRGEIPRLTNLAEGGDPAIVPVNIVRVTFFR